MNILTVENKTLPLSHIPEDIENYNNIFYGVIDYSDKEDIDYKFFPLSQTILEIFNYPGANVSIGDFKIVLPLDWSIVIADKFSGDLEIIELKQLNDRNFDAFVLNPIDGFMPDFFSVQITDIFTDIKWCTPKLRQCHILAIPLELGDSPKCIYCCKDKSKLPDILDITSLV